MADTVPGQTYGDQAQQQRALQVVPLPNQAPPGPQAPPPGAVPFDHPTQRPNEPVTAGLPSGPGPGPEMLGNINPPDPQIAKLSQYLPVLEVMASQPNASDTLQQWVRYLRSQPRQ